MNECMCYSVTINFEIKRQKMHHPMDDDDRYLGTLHMYLPKPTIRYMYLRYMDVSY